MINNLLAIFFFWKLLSFLEDISLFCNFSYGICYFSWKYQVLFMETLELVNGIFSGSDFVEVIYNYVSMWKKIWSD